MNVKSLKSQLFAAVVMMLVACVALGSSTYAWFAMNTTVSATGMTVSTKVSNNLFIAKEPGGLTHKDALDEDAFMTANIDTMDALLEPVSTATGMTDNQWFYTSTSNVLTDGNARSENYITYEDGLDTATGSEAEYYTNAFSKNYAVKKTDHETQKAVGYVDYVFRLKAINTSDEAQKVVLKDLNMTYDAATPADVKGFNAFRVGLYVEDVTTANESGANTQKSSSGSLGQLKGVYAPEGYDYQTTGVAVGSVNGTSAYSYTINSPTNSEIATVAAGKTMYYKVVVRLWIEGEDKSCTNTFFASLTDTWSLSLNAEMQTDTTGAASSLTVAATQEKVNMYNATVDMSTNTITVDGDKFGKVSIQVGSKDVYTSDANVSETTKYYTYSDNILVDVTDQTTYFNT